MKYLILLRNNIENHTFYVEYGKRKEFDFQLRINDEVIIEDFFCRVSDITHDLDDDTCIVRLIVSEVQCIFENESDAIDFLQSEVDEMIELGWYVNDYDVGDNKIILK